MAPPLETPDDRAVMEDFKTTIFTPFQELYGDRWDQARWDSAIARFRAAYSPAVIERFMRLARLPSWSGLEEKMKRGPPDFLRPGWKSPLLGKKIDLTWLDAEAPFECLRPSKSGWRTHKVVIIEFWATWCRPCHPVCRILSDADAKYTDAKVIAFNNEGIFNNAPTNVSTVREFLAGWDDVTYPVYVDKNHLAVTSLFQPGRCLSIPLVFIVTTNDSIVHWVGNPEEMAAPLEHALALA